MEEEQVNFRIFPTEKVNQQFENILFKTEPTMSHEEINKIIDEELYNRVIWGTYFGKDFNPTLYRVTPNFEDFNPNNVNHYSYPPPEVSQKGRANITGSPVLYCSANIATAFREMKEQLQENSTFYISSWDVNFKREVLSHSLLYNTAIIEQVSDLSDFVVKHEKQLKEFVKNMPEEAQEGFIHSMKRMGDLFCMPSSEYYYLTSAYAHSMLYETRGKELEFSWIMYPSIANDFQGINFAIHPDFVKEMMSLKHVFEVTVSDIKSDSIQISVHRKGEVINNVIEWKKPKFLIKSIDSIRVQMCSGESVDINELLDLKINDGITVKVFIQNMVEHIKNQVLPGLFSQDDNDILNPNSQIFKHIIRCDLEHGRKIKIAKGESCIYRLYLKISWCYEYSEEPMPILD